MTVDNEAVRGLFRVMFLVMEISDRIAATICSPFCGS